MRRRRANQNTSDFTDSSYSDVRSQAAPPHHAQASTSVCLNLDGAIELEALRRCAQPRLPPHRARV